MTITTDEIKDRLDEILTDYLSIDSQLIAGCHNDKGFKGSFKYYELSAKKAELSLAHRKLTNALVAIEKYM